MSLISYTLPCHKRESDLLACLPSVIVAANAAPPVEIVVVDYGCSEPLAPKLWYFARTLSEGVSLRTVRCEAQFYHMAHARNVAIRHAAGQIIVAFLADQTIQPGFFKYVREQMTPGRFLKWEETYIFHRQDIFAAGGFDQRFEFYGPEGKEAADRLQRRGLEQIDIMRSDLVSQVRTPNSEKLRNYRLPLSKREMHDQGMVYWRDNQVNGVTVANPDGWGSIA
jgi:hypothetical protein